MSRPDKAHHDRARRAIALAVVIAGGQQIDLMRKLNTWFSKRGQAYRKTKTGIHYWLTQGTLLKSHYWPAIEDITGGVVNRVDLRPDLFPPADPRHVVDAEVLAHRYEAAA